jgi:hypothetical protein
MRRRAYVIYNKITVQKSQLLARNLEVGFAFLGVKIMGRNLESRFALSAHRQTHSIIDGANGL